MTNFGLPFLIQGKVIQGKLEGRKLGFPTANIVLEKEIKSGIYAGQVDLKDKKYTAAIYIGQNKLVLESHLLNFNDDLYGQNIIVTIEKKIREDKKFDSQNELLEAIQSDIRAVEDFYKAKSA